MQTIKERAKAAVKAWEDAGHADATETLEAIELLREIAHAPEPGARQALTDTDIARIYRSIFGGNRWPSDCYPEFARAIESAALGAAQPQPEPPAELLTATNPAQISSSANEPLADLAMDAERYRWLREENAKFNLGFYVGNGTDWVGTNLDDAIDAAIERDKLKGQS